MVNKKKQNQIVIIFIFSTLLNLGCNVTSDNRCFNAKKHFGEEWDFIIKKSNVTFPGNRGFFIESEEGKLYTFFPHQSIATSTESGQRIVKYKNKSWAYVIDKNRDTLKLRLYSDFCDSIIDPELFESKKDKNKFKRNGKIKYI